MDRSDQEQYRVNEQEQEQELVDQEFDDQLCQALEDETDESNETHEMDETDTDLSFEDEQDYNSVDQESEEDLFLKLDDDLKENGDSLDDSLDEDFHLTELSEFDSVEIEDVEVIEDDIALSILESVLFVAFRPVTLLSIKAVFKGTNIDSKKIRELLDRLTIKYADAHRGFYLEMVGGGYQLRTKVDNLKYLKKAVKGKPFKLSQQALEVLSIVAYKQPVVKSEIDEIRGVESGHLLRALMEKSIVRFEGKSDLPGKPMQYGTTRKFLEIFGLRNLRELPTLDEIDQLLPEGITEDQAGQQLVLSQITDQMSECVGKSYSDGEEELGLINEQISKISTSTDFFEEEKKRQKEIREAKRAQDLEEALMVGEELDEKDKRWLERYKQGIEPSIDKTSEMEPEASPPCD